MFLLLLYNLRSEGIKVGLGEWLTFLRGLELGLVTTLTELYGFARSVLCNTEAQFDAFDIAFMASFEGVELQVNLSQELLDWLNQWQENGFEDLVEPNVALEDLWDELKKRLEEQKEEHNGGSRWIGTRGSSPFGHSGHASHGIRVGGASKNRSAISVASERKWSTYRTDRQLDIRDFQMALKELRQLTPAGDFELDIDQSIRKTVDNGGEIELSFRREKCNRIHVVLLMDSGGSMEMYSQMVEQFFTAISDAKGFKSFQVWHFHNVPYGQFFQEERGYQYKSIEDLIQQWTPQHRIFWVGDACMAPYELLSPTRYNNYCGLDWIRRIQEHCPKSAWLNPEPQRFWGHQTISAIKDVVPMFPLSLDGLRQAVKQVTR